MGFLDELKRRADESRQRQVQDSGSLERNALLTDAACRFASHYLRTLAQQLNVLQPVSRAEFRLDHRTAFSQLKLTDFRTDARQKRLRGNEVFDFVVLAFQMKTGTVLSIAKDFPPEIDKLEAKLRQSGAAFESEVVREPGSSRFIEKRFDVSADFHAHVRLVPDHDSGVIDFQVVNLDRLETVSVAFPAIEVGSARLDELARWVVGEPNTFLHEGDRLRRVAA